ncbi:TonB-dependent receptor [Leisingera sp. JC1]|uniref:TonB-dependent receptor n=1 Tax=Leisingera sp. JC1 TaxID=1855282 RepID=UPI000802B22B|nr:TonB-dependent siderophore receptor [Leisingera sp. JC1]OBY24386.1 energy transducer TonB [Leisingera sp. JC1]
MRKNISLLAALALVAGEDAVAQDATEQEIISLEPIVVKVGEGTQSTATIGVLPPAHPGGQVAQGGRLGLLGNRDIMDTPFNITSYTAQTMEDQQARTLADVTLNDASVSNTASPGGMLDSFFIRGFPINEGNFGEIAFDGVFGIAPAFRIFTEYAERIEVLKGPAAVLNGISPNSSVGGSINIVPKRAAEEDLTRLTFDYASELEGGAHLDLSRRFGADRQFGLRFNGSYHTGDTAIDHQEREAAVGALALDYRGDRLRATLDLIAQREDFEAPLRPIFALSGFEIPDAPDGQTNVQQPWETSQVDDVSALGRVEYDFGDSLTLFASAGSGNTRVERFFGIPILLDSAGNASTTPQNFVFDIDRTVGEIGLRGEFETGQVSHTGTIQANYYKGTLHRAANNGTTLSTNILDPVSHPPQFVAQPGSVPKVSENEFSGISLADTMSFFGDRTQLTLGLRWQHVDTQNFSGGAVTASSSEDEVTPLIGLVVKPRENVSLYANYVEGLSIGDTAPTIAANAGETLAPAKSEQIEIGAKIGLNDWTVTASAFQIDKPFSQLDSGNVFAESGEQRNRGLEFSIFGEMAPGLRLLGGVTLLDGELRNTTDPAMHGNEPIGVPSLQATLGAEWDTPFLAGLTLSGNVIHTGDQYVDAANTQEISSWTRFDMGARYSTEISSRPVTFRAEIENLFDAGYYSGVASFGTFSQGAPRTFRLSMTTTF